jgi:DNA transformation protein and related proteins
MPGRLRPAPPGARAQARALPEFVSLALELLAPLGPTRAKPMFGGWGLYADGIFVALVADDRLYLKADAESAPAFAAAGGEPFVFETPAKRIEMSYWLPPAEALESPALMAPWARLAMAAALRARAAKPVPKPKSKPKAGPAGEPRGAPAAKKARASR